MATKAGSKEVVHRRAAWVERLRIFEGENGDAVDEEEDDRVARYMRGGLPSLLLTQARMESGTGQEEGGKKAYEEYQKLCVKHHVQPNPTAAITLYTRSTTLRLRRPATDIDLIPVLELLSGEHSNFVDELDLSGLRLSSASGLLLRELLRHPNCRLRSIRMPRNLIRDEGMFYLIDGIKQNRRLEHIDVSWNRIGPQSAAFLASALADGETGQLRYLKLDNNYLEQKGVDILGPECEKLEIHCCADGNHVLSEILNGVTHGVGLLGAIIAGSDMVMEARRNAIGPWLLGSVIVFVIALCTMYCSSCMYHSFFRMGNVKKVLRVMDHCAIFSLIAATYTPFLLKYIWSDEHERTILGPLLFYTVWGFALAGITMSSGVLRRTPSRTFRASLGLAMGWLVLLSMKVLWERMPTKCLLLIVTGGLFYTIGVPFYIKGREVSIYHVVWHVAIMFGATAHYAGVLWYVVRTDGDY
ncbi:UPF0073 membrane protein [Porphyridium purpureum]|uniref:UPF0073 membrane protein n=1 Tax=Porphyridium purpureum TaxID=35688 RepID=A0A5J4Z656_PORPP|nr:UPF0073 membrane protein [Porphyridium purpureum]|eukprot:POR1450..scf295_1